ncbi:MAG: ComEC/Rec2 family competence protein [Candidatus Nealsonbacteria bacterium]
MTASRIFLYLCLSFVAGIFIGPIFFPLQPLLLGFLILGVFLTSVPLSLNFKKKAVFVCAGFCLLFLALGVWRHQQVLSDIPQIKEENVSFTAIVIKDPDIRETSIKLTLRGVGDPLIEGKILVTTSRYPEYQYGERLKITGKLETPPVFDGFNYRDYLKKDGIFAVMSWPKIEVLGAGAGNPVMSLLLSFKNKFKESIRRFISPPESGILEALVFGDEGGISKEWREKLNFTGTRHIAAVSGMNISIITILVLNVFLGLGLWRKQAFYFSAGLIVLYILTIGAPASAVRAGIMGGIFLFAQYLGRLSSASRAVVFAAAMMLFFNPLLLRLDIGFQLSFLAILGIIYLQPSFTKWLKHLPDFKFFPLRATLAATLSAQIFTLPVLIYNFGYMPVLSPVANILIVPLLAPITIIIFIFGLASMFFWPLGYVLSWPVWLAIAYLTSVIDVFSKFPFASLVITNIHWSCLLLSGMILGFLAWRLNKKPKVW